MKEVNESLYKFESEFEKEKAKLRNSFCMMIKLVNHELIKLAKFRKNKAKN